MTLDFDVRHERDRESQVDVIAVRGEIDIFTAPDVKKAGVEAVDAGASRIVLDLSETTFLDSTALGVIIGLAKRVRPAGGDVVLVNTDAGIARTLEITGLDEIFKIFAERDAALGAFG